MLAPPPRRRRAVLAVAAAAGSTVRRVVLGVRWLTAHALALAGAGFLSFGAWLAYRPAGFVVLGGLCLADAVADRVTARRGGDR